MELLTPHLQNIRVAKPTDKVYKDECMFSFDNPVSEFLGYVSDDNRIFQR